MFGFAILASLAAIVALCWLQFTLAVYALPLFSGIAAGTWAFHTGAGWLGGIAVGVFAAGLVFGIGQLLLAVAKPLWLRIAVALAFVTPAAIAGFHATHGILKHTVPSEGWLIAFSAIGAIAVGVTALMRIAAITVSGPA